ncbi:MAG: tetratricopeptide repeat protein [Pseudomonadota bacterium]|nr:tetratricopeptide repeat protein [Pseudomonadota bacterium]
MVAREIIEEGFTHHQAGRLEEAEQCYRQVLSLDTGNQDALHFLGLIAHQRGDLEGAVDLIGRALEIDEGRPTFHYNLGVVRAGLGDLGGAVASYQRALSLAPDHFDAAYSLGTMLGQAGNPVEALTVLETALALMPHDAKALSAKSAVLEILGRSGDAAFVARQAIEADGNLAEAWTNLGTALVSTGDLSGAEAAHRRALEINPEYAPAHFNLGNALNDLWRGTEARAEFRRALELDPNDWNARGNHLMNLLYDEGVGEAELFEEHRKWAPDGHVSTTHPNSPEPERRLRVGYVSPDFRTHSCAYFLEPLFANHDKGVVETFAYSGVERADETTGRLRALVDHWRSISGVGDDAAAEAVAADGIDILVDTAGHSRGGRPRLFAARPAPVQINWLGYAATTGIKEMDYRIPDAIADPAGAADKLHSETLIRLEGGFHCYRPPDNAPDVTPPPMAENVPVTFASFNNPTKINSNVIAVWAKLLAAVPSSRLLLKGRGLEIEAVRTRLLGAFAAQGIDTARIETLAWVPRDEVPLRVYGRADIALDTFPYNGTTTTLEALWMGLPVVTLAGGRHSARVGASLLSNGGLGLEIAETPEAYVEIAAALAGAPELLAEFRQEVRGILRGSPLVDGNGFAAKMEDAYRQTWQRWCART